MLSNHARPSTRPGGGGARTASLTASQVEGGSLRHSPCSNISPLAKSKISTFSAGFGYSTPEMRARHRSSNSSDLAAVPCSSASVLSLSASAPKGPSTPLVAARKLTGSSADLTTLSRDTGVAIAGRNVAAPSAQSSLSPLNPVQPRPVKLLQVKTFLSKPRRWSLSSLIVLTLILSALYSFLATVISFIWIRENFSRSMATRASLPFFAPSLRTSNRRSSRDGIVPRIVHLIPSRLDPTSRSINTREVEPMSVNLIEEHVDDWYIQGLEEHRDPSDPCVPIADWHTKSYPTCNLLHEIHLWSAAENSTYEESLSVLGEGWFRTTWQYDRWWLPNNKTSTQEAMPAPVASESMVLKTLRIERDFKPEYYELHRRDAIAMERLTASPFVVNIHAACGNSALNELANFQMKSLEEFNRQMRSHGYAPQAQRIKLKMASALAVGLSHVHAAGVFTHPVHAHDDDLGRFPVSMAHYDVNPRNVALFAGGRPKLNDFNIAEFLRYNPATNQTCGFLSRMHEPWWRAPEEMDLNTTVFVNEKVDVYALGLVLFHTLTTFSPRGKMKKERMESVRPLVARGVPPTLPAWYAETQDPSVVAIRTAMERCFMANPVQRPSAKEIAESLVEAWLNVKTDSALEVASHGDGDNKNNDDASPAHINGDEDEEE